MDYKRFRHRALKNLISILCVMALVSCSWVKDDNDDCPDGFWLKLQYDYNILDVDAAMRYMKDAYVYVYDNDGNFVKRIYATGDDLKAHNYRIRVDGLTEGDYQFVVWSGIDNNQFTLAGETQTKDEFRLSLIGNGSSYNGELPPIYYGSVTDVHFDDSYSVFPISMMKNTNLLSCLVVSVDDTTLSADDYTLKVVTANGVMDGDNEIATDTPTTYVPYVSENVTFDDPDYGELKGAMYALSTLRIMEDSDCRIIFEKKETGETLFNISLPEYIGMIGSLYTNLGRPLSVQEYLDRQDFYTIVFYLNGDLDQLIQLRVNSWRVRTFNHLKL